MHSRALATIGEGSLRIGQEHARRLLDDAALALLGREPQSRGEWETLARRLGAAARGKRYSTWYVRNLMMGYQPMTRTVYQAARTLLASLNERAAEVGFSTVAQVRVADGVLVQPNSVVLVGSRTCTCGIDFVPKTPNQVYHSALCARLSRRRQ